jgi:hypothetical protein
LEGICDIKKRRRSWREERLKKKNKDWKERKG